jgi:hypothetical protein
VLNPGEVCSDWMNETRADKNSFIAFLTDEVSVTSSISKNRKGGETEPKPKKTFHQQVHGDAFTWPRTC